MFPAKLGHSMRARPLIEEREAHLVRRDRDAGVDDHSQVRGVGIGEAEVEDQSLVLELL